MTLSESFNPTWQSYFSAGGLHSFDDFWRLEMTPLDKPNRRGKGHSEVGCLQLSDQQTKKQFYMKRQYHYLARTLAHPLQGEPLTEKEFANIQRLQGLGIACMDWAYRGYDVATSRSILITPELTGYQAFDQLYPAAAGSAQAQQRSQDALRCSARLIARLHDQSLQHSALYPNHVFVDLDCPEPEACFIDIEGLFKNPLGRWRVRMKDLSTFFRRAHLDASAQALFMAVYIEHSTATFDSERLLQRINKRTERKVEGLKQKRLRRAAQQGAGAKQSIR